MFSSYMTDLRPSKGRQIIATHKWASQRKSMAETLAQSLDVACRQTTRRSHSSAARRLYGPSWNKEALRGAPTGNRAPSSYRSRGLFPRIHSRGKSISKTTGSWGELPNTVKLFFRWHGRASCRHSGHCKQADSTSRRRHETRPSRLRECHPAGYRLLDGVDAPEHLGIVIFRMFTPYWQTSFFRPVFEA